MKVCIKLRRLFIEDDDKLIKIKSLRPWVDRSYGRTAICWPTMLIDARGYCRQTVSPIWNIARFKRVFLINDKDPTK
jgi:hypothetical protein